MQLTTAAAHTAAALRCGLCAHGKHVALTVLHCAVLQVNLDNQHLPEHQAGLIKYNFNDDCPVFDGMFDYCRCVLTEVHPVTAAQKPRELFMLTHAQHTQHCCTTSGFLIRFKRLFGSAVGILAARASLCADS